MLDHGTGTVIGSTAVVGDNCSILHHVTLGGSGRKDVDRHPKVGEGCLIGAGSSILGNVRIGNRVQIGAGSLVLEDVDDNAVVVGVPARVVGKVGVEAPAEAMDEVSVLVEGSEFSV
jgi:serine O-acetyltransferase